MPIDLHSELLRVRRDLLTMGAVVEQRVEGVIKSIVDNDAAAAQRIRDGDTEVDRMEMGIEEECMRLLALTQPVAGDLRFILAVLRINGELERIADLAKGIAKRQIRISAQTEVRVPAITIEMGRSTRMMLAEVLTGLSDSDPDRCRRIATTEEAVDRLHKQVAAWVREEIARTPASASVVIDILTISQRFERMADIVTCIAEDVVFLVEGRVVRHGGL
jgi:phosphate transport system protein